MCKDNIYYQIAETEPIQRRKDIWQYPAGWIVWIDDNEFKGPFESYFKAINFKIKQKNKEFINNTPKSIEKYIEELIDKKMENKYLASKGYVQAAITERITGKPTTTFDSNAKKEVISGQTYSKWIAVEEVFVKDELNNFISSCSNKIGRSSASIKAKIFRLLQESYQKV